jgi:diacylglycerol O-acyltransferase / wax synthase
MDRLSPLDASFLYFEDRDTPMHVGSVAVFQAPTGGFDYERLVELIQERITLVSRYRQRVRPIPGRLANPVWVDDEEFDLGYHVRRSAVPKPGTDEQLHELVARVMSRPLERARPLWEMYLVEGLSDHRFAVLSKTHHAVVDGVSAVDIGQLILDETPQPRDTLPDAWRPTPEPGWSELVAAALAETVRRPRSLVDNLRGGIADVERTAGRAFGALSGVTAAAMRTVVRPAPTLPLNGRIGPQRRFATADTSLDVYRQIRAAHGGTVNDVVLATVAGALRTWLLTRGEPVRPATTVRALVPVSVRRPEEKAALGNRVSSYLVDLPVGEPNAVMRLQRVSYAMQAHKDSGHAVAAEALIGLAGFAPPTLHALGARVASGVSRRVFNLVVTNVPGPQIPLYAGGARMLAAYPVVPLAHGQAVAVGVTSYAGGLYYGFNADRDGMSDVAVLAQCLVDALDELAEVPGRGADGPNPH